MGPGFSLSGQREVGQNIGPTSVSEALERILASQIFADAPRLREFLRFVVTRSLSGDHEDLKESVIGIEVFQKSSGFDTRLDSTIRVAASRLRGKLRAYYAREGAEDTVEISLPEGHYLPRFSLRRQATPSVSASGYPATNLVTQPEAGTRVFIGRELELSRLEERLALTSTGCGHMVCIVGEPGAGKTALLEAFLEAARGSSSLVTAVGQCRQELEHTEPYLAWIEILENLVQNDAQIAGLLQASAPTWWSRLGLLHAAVHVQQGSSVKRELLAFLRSLAERSALVLVLEDLHWADSSAVDLLAYLAPALPSLPILLLSSYRPSDLILRASPFLKIEAELKMHHICEDLLLSELGLADVQKYLDVRFPGHALPPDVAPHLQARSQGNALCLAAAVDYAVQRNWVASQGGRWALAIPLREWGSELPPSVDSMIRWKLAKLLPDDRELLMAAAVQGTEFDSAVVAHALTVDDWIAGERLSLLESVHRLLRTIADVRLAGHTSRRYRFAHVLYREGLLHGMEPARRRRVSHAVAEAIVTCYGDSDARVVGDLARLFLDAESGEPALPYCARAAARAVELSAYRQALDVSKLAADAARQCRPSATAKRLEIELLTTQALSLTSLQGFGATEVEPLYHRARQLAQELGEPNRVTSLAHIHWALVANTNLNAARILVDSLLAEADTSTSPEARALARMTKGITLIQLGEPSSALTLLLEGAEQWRNLEGHLSFRSYTLDPAVATECNLARALWFVGRPDEAWQRIMRGVGLADRIGHRRTIAYALGLAADIAHLRRDVASTTELAARAADMSREYELPYELAWARFFQAWAYAQSGDLSQAAGAFEEVSQYRGPCATKVLSHFAELLARQSRATEALAVIDQAFRFAAERGERYYVPELQRVCGEILVRSGRREEMPRAEQFLTKALRTASRCRARSFELRAATSLARYCLEFRPRRAAPVLARLRGIVQTFPEVTRTPDVVEARDMLGGGQGD
jgi:tetratricopeptide (TPR) repeat protein